MPWSLVGPQVPPLIPLPHAGLEAARKQAAVRWQHARQPEDLGSVATQQQPLPVRCDGNPLPPPAAPAAAPLQFVEVVRRLAVSTPLAAGGTARDPHLCAHHPPCCSTRAQVDKQCSTDTAVLEAAAELAGECDSTATDTLIRHCVRVCAPSGPCNDSLDGFLSVIQGFVSSSDSALSGVPLLCARAVSLEDTATDVWGLTACLCGLLRYHALCEPCAQATSCACFLPNSRVV